LLKESASTVVANPIPFFLLVKRIGEDELQPAGNATNLDKLWKFVEFEIHLWSIDSVCVCATIRSQCVRACERQNDSLERKKEEEGRRASD
jgi:hypothetical protein